jgi:hypothetical protein
MEHRDDAPLADEPQPGAIPNDQPAGGGAAPNDPDEPADPPGGEDDDGEG